VIPPWEIFKNVKNDIKYEEEGIMRWWVQGGR